MAITVHRAVTTGKSITGTDAFGRTPTGVLLSNGT